MTSGGSCRSLSMTTTQSPPAWSMPAVIAAWWPKFLDSDRTLTRGSRSAIRRQASREPSVDPSSTSRSTTDPAAASVASRQRRQNCSITSDSL